MSDRITSVCCWDCDNTVWSWSVVHGQNYCDICVKDFAPNLVSARFLSSNAESWADAVKGLDQKPSNPKDAAGTTRAPLHLLPLPALVAWSSAHLEGGLKYGFWNWTIVGVRSSVYVAAAARHIFKWFFGQRVDAKTGVHHLGYAMACLAIIIDAEHREKLVDDRPPALPKLDELFEQAEATAKQLIGLYGSVNPKHYTIADTEKEQVK